MILVNKIKEIASKIHDTTISDWADEIRLSNPNRKDDFPNETHWWILISIAIVIGILGLLVCLT
jgi:hypothetical protein